MLLGWILETPECVLPKGFYLLWLHKAMPHSPHFSSFTLKTTALSNVLDFFKFCFHFLRVNIFSTRNIHVIFASFYIQKSFGITIGKIACKKPAFLYFITRFNRIVPISRRYDVTFNTQLPYFI